MKYLYERQNKLKKEIEKLQPQCFNPQVKPVLKELRCRLDEVNKIIREIEHEI